MAANLSGYMPVHAVKISPLMGIDRIWLKRYFCPYPEAGIFTNEDHVFTKYRNTSQEQTINRFTQRNPGGHPPRFGSGSFPETDL